MAHNVQDVLKACELSCSSSSSSSTASGLQATGSGSSAGGQELPAQSGRA
jgi:hypothetical protein